MRTKSVHHHQNMYRHCRHFNWILASIQLFAFFLSFFLFISIPSHSIIYLFVHSLVRSSVLPFDSISISFTPSYTNSENFFYFESFGFSCAESHLHNWQKLHFRSFSFTISPRPFVPSTPIYFTRSNFLLRSLFLSIWFDSFASLLVSISREEIPFIWPRLTYFQWKIMFKWWKKILLCLADGGVVYHLNGAQPFSICNCCPATSSSYTQRHSYKHKRIRFYSLTLSAPIYLPYNPRLPLFCTPTFPFTNASMSFIVHSKNMFANNDNNNNNMNWQKKRRWRWRRWKNSRAL